MTADPPFASAHSPKAFLATEGRRQTLERLDEGLGAREPFLLVTGEPGVGKSALVHEAIARWGKRAHAALVAHPELTRAELLEELARRFGADPPAGASKPQLLAALEAAWAKQAERGKTPVIVMEDAHQLAPELLEELRQVASAEILAGRPVEVLLVGMPQLEERLLDAALARVVERIAVRCRVEPLSRKETRQYVHHRMTATGADGPAFTRESCREIHTHSRGIPRAINALATESLRRARAAGAEMVTPDLVAEAADELWRGAAATFASQRERMAPASEPRRAETSEPRRVEPVRAPESRRPEPARAHEPERAPQRVAEPERRRRTELQERLERSAHADRRDDAAPVDAAPRITSYTPQDEPGRVQDWVTRFRGEQGAPRIGGAFDAGLEGDMDALVGEDGVIGAPRTPGRRLIVLDELESASPTAAPMPPMPAISRPASPGRSLGGPALTAAMALLAIVALAVVLPQGRALFTRPATSPAAFAPESAAVAETKPTAPPHPVKSKRAKSPAATTAEAAPTPPQPKLTVDVANFLLEERAIEERDRLAAESGLQGWIVNESDGSYRIVLGVFSTSDRAESAATALLDRGLVTQALVVPLPSRRLRH